MKARAQTGRGPGKPRVVVRMAGTADAEFIRSLSRKAFQPYGPYEEMLPAWFLAGIGLVFVGVLRKRSAGFAMLERCGGEGVSPRISEVLAIAVEPWARNQGVGDRLMEEIIRRADMFQVDKLVLHTAVDNLAGQAVFRKHGFVPCGIEKEFYPEGQDALMMQRAMARMPIRP